MKEQLSQLVQDVIDGEESALKAMEILVDLKKHVNKCFIEVNKVYLSEDNGSNKNIDQH